MLGGLSWLEMMPFLILDRNWIQIKKSLKQLSQLLTGTQTLCTFPSLLPIGVLVMRDQLFVLTFFLKSLFHVFPFFHTETSKVQVANFPAVRHCVVSLRCLAAIVQHVPRNFAHLKRLCGYAECCCILIRFQVYYANLYYTRIQKIQWTHMGTRLSFLKLHVSIQIGLNI